MITMTRKSLQLKGKTMVEADMYRHTGNKWRLVHDGKAVRCLIEGTDRSATSSKHTIEVFKSEKEALSRIKELGLKYEKADSRLDADNADGLLAKS